MTQAIDNRMGEPDEPHGSGQPHVHHAVNYYMIFLLLVVLTIVTVAISMKRFSSEWVNVLLALLVATTKAIFVAVYFMHLKFEGKLIYLILIVPVCLCILLVVALIPDIILTQPDMNSASLHHFHDVLHAFRR